MLKFIEKEKNKTTKVGAMEAKLKMIFLQKLETIKRNQQKKEEKRPETEQMPASASVVVPPIIPRLPNLPSLNSIQAPPNP